MMVSAHEENPSLDAGRVLVVDDHRQARESMADVLRQAGHRVACCSSASEALQVIQQESYDCIITDLKMPGMNGLEFIVQLEQRRYGAQVVMVTAHATVNSAVEAMRHGAFDYIEKPFDVDQIERLVAQAIRHGRLLQQPAGPPRSVAGRTAGHDRLEPVDAGPAGPHCPGRPHPGNRPHHRRKRHRQGTGCPGGPRRQRAGRRRRWSASIAPSSRRT